jgi:tRNA (guanine9-N1)-methyltransferase
MLRSIGSPPIHMSFKSGTASSVVASTIAVTIALVVVAFVGAIPWIVEKKSKENREANRVIAKTKGHVTLASNEPSSEHMSKKALKKQLKYERKVRNRKLKRQMERQQRHQQAVLSGRNIEEEQELVAQRTLIGDGWKRRQYIWETEKLPLVRSSFHICINCSYEKYMTKKEITSLAAQIRCCYAYNKRNDFPCQMVVSNLSVDESPQTLQLLQQEKGYDEWSNRAYIATSLSPDKFYQFYNSSQSLTTDANTITNNQQNKNDKQQQHRQMSKIVYLTSDSEHTLTHLDNDTVYVIGGIVDRNRWKGIAYKRAQSLISNQVLHENSNNNTCNIIPTIITTAKLPLMEYIVHMPSTPVLTINHVFHILLQYRNFSNNHWYNAFRSVLPARKEAQYI